MFSSPFINIIERKYRKFWGSSLGPLAYEAVIKPYSSTTISLLVPYPESILGRITNKKILPGGGNFAKGFRNLQYFTLFCSFHGILNEIFHLGGLTPETSPRLRYRKFYCPIKIGRKYQKFSNSPHNHENVPHNQAEIPKTFLLVLSQSKISYVLS